MEILVNLVTTLLQIHSTVWIFRINSPLLSKTLWNDSVYFIFCLFIIFFWKILGNITKQNSNLMESLKWLMTWTPSTFVACNCLLLQQLTNHNKSTCSLQFFKINISMSTKSGTRASQKCDCFKINLYSKAIGLWANKNHQIHENKCF